MSPSQTDVVKVVEPGTELGLDQRIGRRVEFASNTIWLETINASGCEVNIISPSGNNRVSGNRSAGNSGRSKAAFKAYIIIVCCKILPFHASEYVIFWPSGKNPLLINIYFPTQL